MIKRVPSDNRKNPKTSNKTREKIKRSEEAKQKSYYQLFLS